MIELPYSVELFDAVAREVVDASVVPLDRRLTKIGIVAAWWQLPETTGTQRRREPDHKWKWIELIGRERQTHGSSYQTVAVQSSDTGVQGVVTYWINKLSHLDTGLGAVEIDRLAIAPRNRPRLCEPPSFKGVGFVLLRHVIWHSYRLGCQGRIRLESVNDQQAHDFYRKYGLVVIMEDEGFLEFELPAEAAKQLLIGEGLLP